MIDIEDYIMTFQDIITRYYLLKITEIPSSQDTSQAFISKYKSLNEAYEIAETEEEAEKEWKRVSSSIQENYQ